MRTENLLLNLNAIYHLVMSVDLWIANSNVGLWNLKVLLNLNVNLFKPKLQTLLAMIELMLVSLLLLCKYYWLNLLGLSCMHCLILKMQFVIKKNKQKNRKKKQLKDLIYNSFLPS